MHLFICKKDIGLNYDILINEDFPSYVLSVFLQSLKINRRSNNLKQK